MLVHKHFFNVDDVKSKFCAGEKNNIIVRIGLAEARPLFNDRRKLTSLVDPRLEGRYPMRGLYQALAVASMCIQDQGVARPLIGDEVTALSYLANQGYDPTTLPQSLLISSTKRDQKLKEMEEFQETKKGEDQVVADGIWMDQRKKSLLKKRQRCSTRILKEKGSLQRQKCGLNNEDIVLKASLKATMVSNKFKYSNCWHGHSNVHL